MSIFPARHASRLLTCRPGLRLISVSAIALTSACRTSPAPDRFRPAFVPNGVHGVITLDSGKRVEVELLEVTDTAYVVLTGNRVAVAPYRALRRVYFEHQDWMDQPDHADPSSELRERLRYASRFPFGMPAATLAELLRRGGQDRPDNLAAPSS